MGSCVEKQPQCVKEHGVCGGPGQETQSCCDGLLCDQAPGGTELHCKQPLPQCVKEDGMFCDEVWGSLERHCKQPLPQCVKEHGICGGPGQETQSCCGNLVCDQFPGDAELHCKQPQCLPHDAVCGNVKFGQFGTSCCGDMQCKQQLLRGSDLICSF